LLLQWWNGLGIDFFGRWNLLKFFIKKRLKGF